MQLQRRRPVHKKSLTFKKERYRARERKNYRIENQTKMRPIAHAGRHFFFALLARRESYVPVLGSSRAGEKELA